MFIFYSKIFANFAAPGFDISPEEIKKHNNYGWRKFKEIDKQVL